MKKCVIFCVIKISYKCRMYDKNLGYNIQEKSIKFICDSKILD